MLAPSTRSRQLASSREARSWSEALPPSFSRQTQGQSGLRLALARTDTARRWIRRRNDVVKTSNRLKSRTAPVGFLPSPRCCYCWAAWLRRPAGSATPTARARPTPVAAAAAAAAVARLQQHGGQRRRSRRHADRRPSRRCALQRGQEALRRQHASNLQRRRRLGERRRLWRHHQGLYRRRHVRRLPARQRRHRQLRLRPAEPVKGTQLILKEQTLSAAPRSCNKAGLCVTGGIR